MDAQVALNTVWKCSLCSVFVALTLRVLMNHYYSVHSNDVNFFIRCGIDDCPATFRRYDSFYKHVRRNHRAEYEATNCHNLCPNELDQTSAETSSLLPSQSCSKDQDMAPSDPNSLCTDLDSTVDSSSESTESDNNTDSEDFHQVFTRVTNLTYCMVSFKEMFCIQTICLQPT